MGVGKAFDLKKAIHEVWAVNEAMNQLLLKHMDARAWRAEPPVGGRTIAAIFSHMHNDRLLWMTVWAKGRRRPAHTSRHTVTKEQAARALAQSAKAMENLLAGTRAAEDAVARLCLMLAHDAHHRGQIMMLARQLGYRLPGKVNYGIWHWGKLWRSLGMARRWPMP
ncbi:MAG: hypothetical protein A3D93_04310 [Acidobacteria bacterium RIFCSPHIGHO2_12_FULL_67_30]|nr:MAG: hypothetical protein A2620_04345 [Acidobacteria bacterium RIFCSPHIGHO2_01_FULL_67_28]OFV88122.1 MAG: hypothetical protein A3D93_04310 [Acidobacteria bacterium RIFCSPHIGHO2_12_FULL_67_30]